MSEIEYDACDLHQTAFVQGDVCPECEDEMWQYARDMTEFNYWTDTQLVYQETVVIAGMVYWAMVEEAPGGELIDSLTPVPDGCREPGIPW